MKYFVFYYVLLIPVENVCIILLCFYYFAYNIMNASTVTFIYILFSVLYSIYFASVNRDIVLCCCLPLKK